MSVDRAHADRIAHLARLRFQEEELTRITADLNHILEHVESLKELWSGGGAAGEVAPGGHLVTSGAPTVTDRAPTRGSGAETPDRLARDLGEVAPDWRDGFFVVPPLPGVHETEEA
ncbi:MAG TPA: Asp-tRNA(Asn)/Glu-tRNA(Gln) amidotransferase subunit GatC [Longimicrobiales bacterium]|nr:Asp-tRNA(Asn)/Glu-tRNA(Gln) amidotransferase subunit GatC [Longimicrobiales bacterium]